MGIDKQDRRKLRALKGGGGFGGEPIPVLSMDTGAEDTAPVEDSSGSEAPSPDKPTGAVNVVDLDKNAAEPMPDLTPPAAETENQGGAEEELRKKYARIVEIGIGQFIKSVQKKIDWAESKGIYNKKSLLEHGINFDDFEFGSSDDRQRYTDHAFQEVAQRLEAGEKIDHIQNVAKTAAERIEKESDSELGKFIILIEKLQTEEKEAKKTGAAWQPVPASAVPSALEEAPAPAEQAEEEYFSPEQREELEDFVETIRQYREGLLANIENFGEQKYWMIPKDIDNNIIPYARKIYFENFSGHAGLTEEDMDEAVGYALEKIKEK